MELQGGSLAAKMDVGVTAAHPTPDEDFEPSV